MSAKPKIVRLIEEGADLHRAGDLDGARRKYRRALELDPAHPDALHLLGIIANQQGNFAEAARLVERAVKRHPDAAIYHVSLGNAYQGQGRLEEAKRSLQRALEIDPRSVEAHTNLGNTLLVLSEREAATASFRSALALNARHVNAWKGLRAAYMAQGKPIEAAECLRNLRLLEPDKPAHAVDLAGILVQLRRWSDALSVLEPLTNDKVKSSRLYANLGLALQGEGRYLDAELAFRRGIWHDPSDGANYDALGMALHGMARVEEAIAIWAAALDENRPFQSCYSNYLFSLNYSSDRDPREVFRAHEHWGVLAAHAASRIEGKKGPTRREKDKKIRIGYVSGDFRQHSVAYFIEPLFRLHDREEFEVIAYHNSFESDATTASLRSMADRWRDICALDTATVLDLVREDGIDILVDLSGHTGGNRLDVFACRAAPVQASYLGYPNTTGLHGIRYRITDSIADPQGERQEEASEELVRLSPPFLSYAPDPEAPAPAALPALENGFVTFGSFNNLAKVSERTLDLWCEVLANVPNSRLLLKCRPFSEPSIASRWRRMFEARGVDASRLILKGHERSHVDHMNAYSSVDIALDSFPYNGTTTTCEALWMGVPVVNCAGPSHRSRVGASILRSLGLDALACNDGKQFVEQATRLARDLEGLGALRASMRQRLLASALMDHAGFARHVEGAYRQMLARQSDACIDRRQVAGSSEPAPRPWSPPCNAVFRGADTVRVTTAGGSSLYAPADLMCLSTFVLLELEDWFEDEIRFVRDILEQGQTFVDIGANLGVYATAASARVGSAGAVIAFEPAARTASLLERSAAEAPDGNLMVVRAAVSDREGEGRLVAPSGSESAHLASGAGEGAGGEPIRLISLDRFARQEGLLRLDFLKIDAEGHEQAVLDGATRTLKRFSPLIMLEVRQGDVVNLSAVDALRKGGYGLYKLMPGIQVLVPIRDGEELERYALNLFACKPDRAQALEQRGWLWTGADARSEVHSSFVAGAFQAEMASLPYLEGVRALHSGNVAANEPCVDRGLDCYAACRQKTRSPGERANLLIEALGRAEEAAAASATPERLMNVVRLAAEAGQRGRAVDLLRRLLGDLSNADSIDPSEPFLSPAVEFELVGSQGAWRAWAEAACLHSLGHLYHYSAYYLDPFETLARIDLQESLGFHTALNERRRQLIRLRCLLQNSPARHPLLDARAGTLNREFWAPSAR